MSDYNPGRYAPLYYNYYRPQAQDRPRFVFLNINSSFRRQKPILHSFEWRSNVPKVKLYSALIESELIPSEASLDNFISIFSKKEVRKIGKISWLSTQALFVYFLNSLSGIVAEHGYEQRFAIGSKCFNNQNGKEFNSRHLARTSYNARKFNKTKNTAKIDKIISPFTKS